MTDESEIIGRIRLLNTENIGAVTFHKLLRRFGTAQKALENLPPAWKPCPLSFAETEYRNTLRQKINLIFFDSPLYPPLLNETAGAPPLLYAAGDTGLLNYTAAVAVVGSRNASANSRRLASRFAFELTEAGIMIVSGMARGIDAAAHKGAMHACSRQGPTIAVLGTGIDMIYPEENRELYNQILAQGLILSEFPLGTSPQAQNFPRRNRIVSGLAQGTLIVEAGLQSGSLITARLALEQGRDVFAVPGSPLDSRSAGANRLIREGAFLTETSEDILSRLTAFSPRPRPPARSAEPKLFDKPLDKAENNDDIPQQQKTTTPLTEFLGSDGVYVDELIRLSGLSPADLSAQLLDLELDGLIERQPGNKIVLIKK